MLYNSIHLKLSFVIIKGSSIFQDLDIKNNIDENDEYGQYPTNLVCLDIKISSQIDCIMSLYCLFTSCLA